MGGVSYAYDGDGNRVSRTLSGTLTWYLLDTQPRLTVVLAETTSSATTRYVHDPTGILAQQNPDNAMRWMLQDGMQSVRAISDGMNVLSAQAYSPYGEPMYNDLPTEFGFTGEQTDPTNDLVYLRARYLNPKLGIFGSLDPFEGELSAPLTMNGYGWVEGNVSNRTDPTGLKTCNSASGSGNSCPPTNEWSARESKCLHNSSGIIYEASVAWAYFLGEKENGSRREMTLLYALGLRDQIIRSHQDSSLRITDFEMLARVADYSAGFPNTSGQDVLDDLGWIYAGSQLGSLGLITSLGYGIVDLMGRNTIPVEEGISSQIFGNFANPAGSGLHSDYEDNKNQVFHFTPYASSSSRSIIGGGLGYLGNWIHEDLGIPDFGNGSSWQDSNLAYAGIALGYQVQNQTLSTNQIGNWIRTVLTNPLPRDFGTHPDNYPWIQICQGLGGNCQPSVPYPYLVPFHNPPYHHPDPPAYVIYPGR